MGLIGNYPQDLTLALNDVLLGTDPENNNATKNYSLESIKDFLATYFKQVGVDVVVIANRSTTDAIDTTAYQWNGNTTSAAFTLTLPEGVQGQTFKIVNVGTGGNDLTLAPDGAELLLGDNSGFLLRDKESIIISYDQTYGWY